jgi:biotin synthase-like enzyme
MYHEDLFSDSQVLLENIKRADKKTREVHGAQVDLERAIILSWWCDRGNCSFCYMSTQKKRIKDKSRARRRTSSILAEALLLRRIGWKVAFLSGGYGAFKPIEIREIVHSVYEIIGEPLWLNVGVLSEDEMSSFGDSVNGVVGSVETLNPRIRKKVCPTKPVEPIVSMFESAGNLGLNKGMTIILGLGESTEDLELLLNFVEENKIDKITVYSLNPHDQTPFSDSPPPASLYHAGVISALRLRFPKLKIVAGTWIDQLPNIGVLLLAGANGITKYPLFRMFGNRFGKKVEREITYAGRTIGGTFSDVSLLNKKFIFDGPEHAAVKKALDRYVEKIMSRL